jgi:hypothetical protein
MVDTSTAPPPTTATGAPAAPNATTKGAATVFHPTSAAAVAAVMAGLTAVLAAHQQYSGWADYVTGAITFLTAAWAVFAPKASTSA